LLKHPAPDDCLLVTGFLAIENWRLRKIPIVGGELSAIAAAHQTAQRRERLADLAQVITERLLASSQVAQRFDELSCSADWQPAILCILIVSNIANALGKYVRDAREGLSPVVFTAAHCSGSRSLTA